MSDYNKKRQISWDEIKSDSTALAKKLREEFDILPNKILAVSRGGLIPATLIAHNLGIKNIETIGLESYNGQKQSNTVLTLKAANPEYLENTLVIDDLVDTGKTFTFLRSLLTGDCILATLYARPMSEHSTDYFVHLLDDNTWIDFPWEI